jgi:uncharacterized membrane protein YgcG
MAENTMAGWDAVDDRTMDQKPVGDQWRNKFSIEAGETRRILFLDSVPFTSYFHNLWNLAKVSDDVLCLAKNKLDMARGCPLCDAREWARFIGWFTVIDIGLVTLNNGNVEVSPYRGKKDTSKTYSCMKRMLGAHRGSEEQPGMLITLRNLAARQGGMLEGTVWDVSRSGEKSPRSGNVFLPIGKIPMGEVREYLIREYGADERNLKGEALESFNWKKEFPTMPFEQMQRLASGAMRGGQRSGGYGGGHGNSGYGAGSAGGSSGTGGAGTDGFPDDDVPF